MDPQLRARLDRLAGVARAGRRSGSRARAVLRTGPAISAPCGIEAEPVPRSSAWWERLRDPRRLWLALVLSIGLALVGAWLVVVGGSHRSGGRLRPVRSDLRVVQSAVILWSVENAGCPSLDALALDPAARTRDAWGRPFVIDCSGEWPTVFSVGPDGRPGTGDDIRA
jgi:hypothetical protein